MIISWLNLEKREDTEHEQVFIRLFICLFIFAYAYFFADPLSNAREHILMLSGSIFVFGLFILSAIIFYPAPSIPRRLIAIIIDIGGMSYGMSQGEQWPQLLFWLYLFVIIGNGFRYGVRYLYFSSALSIMGFFIAIQFNSQLLENGYLSIGFIFGLSVLTIYLAGLLNRLNQALEAANEASVTKSNFLANMSHEIRTPMNGVLGMLDIALTSKMDGGLRNNIKVAQSSANSLMTILNDILDLSKLDADKVELENSDYSINTLLEEIVSLFAPEAEKKGILLSYKVLTDTNSYRVNGDKLRLRQVLLNLVSNAIKFTEEGEVELIIEVKKASTGLKLQCSVRDTGLGMEKKHADHIFNAFTQADETTSRKFGGTGLGLAISKKLIEKMGGDINVESVIDIGSTFSFSIVANEVIDHSQDETETSRLKQQVELGNVNAKPHILVVEDNPVNQQVMIKILEHMGCVVYIAGNGREAVNYFKEDSPKPIDLIFMDIQMPELNGYEAIPILHGIWLTKPEMSVPIIALTAAHTATERIECQLVGMDDFMTKPVDTQKIYAVLKHWLPSYDHAMSISMDCRSKPLSPVSSKVFNVLFDQQVLQCVKAEMGGGFKSLVETYKINSRDTILTMEESLEKNLPALQTSSTSLKGSSISLGATKMSELCGYLQNDVIFDKHPASIEKDIRKIKQMLEVTVGELQKVC